MCTAKTCTVNWSEALLQDHKQQVNELLAVQLEVVATSNNVMLLDTCRELEAVTNGLYQLDDSAKSGDASEDVVATAVSNIALG